MFSINKSQTVCIFCVAVIACGCGNVTESLSPDYHEKKGLALLEQGDFPKAEEELKLAISLAARDSGPKAGPVGRMNAELAGLYKKQNKLDFADEGYRRALIVFSEKPELLNDADREAWVACLRSYAEVLRGTGRGDEADIREAQAQKILEKMGKPTTAPAPEKGAPPAATPEGQPGQQPASTAQPQTTEQPGKTAPDMSAPAAPGAEKPQATSPPADTATKSEAKPAAGSGAETKPAPAKAETKPPAAKPPAKSGPTKGQ